MAASPCTPAPFPDTVLLAGTAGFIAADTRRFFSRERIENTAASDERARLAREKAWAATLDQFNNGLYPGGPGHCE